MQENNQELIKKSLFKVKKITIKTIDTINVKGEATYKTRNVGVGILVPLFNSYRENFEESRIQILTVDGSSIEANQKSIILDNTRIMDANIKEDINNMISEAKKVYEQQKKIVKNREDYEKLKQSLSEKLKKNEDSLTKSFVKLKKTRGFLSKEDIVKHLNKGLDKVLIKHTFNKNAYKTIIPSGNYKGVDSRKELTIFFDKDYVSQIRLVKEIDFGKWCADKYDFVYEEYDRTLHVGDISNSPDFKKIKSEYFKSNNSNDVLKKANAIESFDAEVGDKDSLSAYHTVYIQLNLECRKENLKELEDKINLLLTLV